MLRSRLESGTFVELSVPNIKLPIGTNSCGVKLYETDQSRYICFIFSFNHSKSSKFLLAKLRVSQVHYSSQVNILSWAMLNISRFPHRIVLIDRLEISMLDSPEHNKVVCTICLYVFDRI